MVYSLISCGRISLRHVQEGQEERGVPGAFYRLSKADMTDKQGHRIILYPGLIACKVGIDH